MEGSERSETARGKSRSPGVAMGREEYVSESREEYVSRQEWWVF